MKILYFSRRRVTRRHRRPGPCDNSSITRGIEVKRETRFLPPGSHRDKNNTRRRRCNGQSADCCCSAIRWSRYPFRTNVCVCVGQNIFFKRAPHDSRWVVRNTIFESSEGGYPRQKPRLSHAVITVFVQLSRRRFIHVVDTEQPADLAVSRARQQTLDTILLLLTL